MLQPAPMVTLGGGSVNIQPVLLLTLVLCVPAYQVEVLGVAAIS